MSNRPSVDWRPATHTEATIQYTVQIRVTPRPGILDPEGETIGRALETLGYEGVNNVRAGRLVTLRLEADGPEAARVAAEEMCERLIANPIIEDYAVQVEPAADAPETAEVI